MPELPEVETQCRFLRRAGIITLPITGVTVTWERTLGGLARESFAGRLIGEHVSGILRRGKFIVIELSSGDSLLVHLRMTGSLVLRDSGSDVDIHDRVIINFGDIELAFHDPRKFGRIVLTSDPTDLLGKLGPEPLDDELTQESFHVMLQSKNRQIKPLLLDQGFIAGLGNIYTDECLFLTGIHPQRVSSTLSVKEASVLLQSIRQTLLTGISNGGTSLGGGEGNFRSGGSYGANADALQVFMRTGKPCFRCGTLIERAVIGQRATHFCPHCQGKP